MKVFKSYLDGYDYLDNKKVHIKELFYNICILCSLIALLYLLIK
jgi:hypothetical protein